MNQQQLEKANIDNLTDLWRLMGHAKIPLKHNNTLFASTNWPDRMWFDWFRKPDSVDIRVLKAELRQAALNCIVPVWHNTDCLLTNTLIANGYEVLFEQTAMVLTVHRLPKLGKIIVAIKLVNSPETIQVWSHIASKAFGYYVHAPVVQNLVNNPSIRLAIAYAGDNPVATGLLFGKKPVAGIHMVGVHPRYRGQGIATQITRFLIHYAALHEYPHVTLQASAMGRNMYTQLGFKRQFSFYNYAKIGR